MGKDAPEWYKARVAELYPYVGPPEIRERARHQAHGTAIHAAADLVAWLRAQGVVRNRELTATFVVDASGCLRLADRHTEHVACAGGQPVRSAGEMTFSMSGGAACVTSISNQSTGYCPGPDSWPEVERALDAFGLAHPDSFTSAFEFRRCPACGQTNLIKDGVFRCDACDAELPVARSFGA